MISPIGIVALTSNCLPPTRTTKEKKNEIKMPKAEETLPRGVYGKFLFAFFASLLGVTGGFIQNRLTSSPTSSAISLCFCVI